MSLISKKKFMNGVEKRQSKTTGASNGLINKTDFTTGVQGGNEEMSRRRDAFEAYKKAVEESRQAAENNAASRANSGTKKERSGALSAQQKMMTEQEYSRSPAMQQQYGTYQNYLRGVDAAQGRQLGTEVLRQQSAALLNGFRPAVKQAKDEKDRYNARVRANETVQRDQVRGMQRTSEILAGEIYKREVEQADAHFTGTGLSESGKSTTQLQTEIEALQQRKGEVDAQSVIPRAQDAMQALSEEDRKLLRQYRGKEQDGYSVQGLAKGAAKKTLNARGFTDKRIKELAEWQEILEDYENAAELDKTAREIGETPIIGTLLSAAIAPAKTLGNVESLRSVLPAWAGGYQNKNMPTNIYSPLYGATRLSPGIRQSVMQDMGSVGQFLYQAGTSALDSAVNMATSAGLVGIVGGASGAAAQKAIAETMNWVMGSQVAADSVYEGIQNGKSNRDALIDGIVEGTIEGITEKYSVGKIIENMLSGKAVWKKALRSFSSEGAEEFMSNWLNRVYDVVSKQDRGEVLTAYAAYIADGKTPKQALAAMVGDFAKEDGPSFLAGGLSGLAMAGTYAGVSRTISEVNITQTARAVLEEGEVQDVIDYGMAQEENTKAHRLAEALQATVDEGGEVTQKAVEDTLREVAKEQQAAVDEGEEPRVPEKLTRLEQIQQAAAQEQAQAETGEQTYQIYKDAVEAAQEATRAAQEYARAEQEQRQQQEAEAAAQQRSGEMRAAQRAQRAAEQAQYDQGSLLSQIPGTEEIGELDPEQYARQQTADAEQALDEAAIRQEEDYLAQRARQAGYDEQTAAYFLNGNTTGLPAEQYAASFGKIYEQGRLGASEQRAMRFAEGMNQSVAEAAYQAGLAAGQKGDTNGSGETTGKGQIGQARQRAEGAADGVRGSAAQQQRAEAGRKRAEGARALAKTWNEVTVSALGLGKNETGTVRVMPEGGENASEDIKRAVKHLKAAGVKNVKIFAGQLAQSVNGQTLYADAAALQDGTVLIRADSAEYSAFELAKHESYHILAKQNPEMAARIRTRLLSEGKITREMIESYVDAYARAYGDDTDAYLEEIVADAYAGMNRTDYGTNQLRADVQMEVGQWKKKTGSARAPPAKYSMVGRGENGLKTYKSDFSSDMTIEEKKTYMYRLITEAWDKKPISLTILEDGKERQITARFDGEANGEKFAGKMAYGNRRGSRTERLITLNLANDIWEITNESTYDNSKDGNKQTRIHDGTERWSYFTNAINYVDDAQPNRNGVYDFNLDVMRREDGDFVYTFYLKKRRTDAPRTFTAGVDGKNAADADSSKDSISKTGETVKTKFSASVEQAPEEQRKQNNKAALDYFGKTYNWNETGYILLNGSRLDFSGRHEGGPGGYRTVDHRDIIDALGEDYGGGDYSGGMVRFMQEGNIRISPESGGINLSARPTNAQMEALSSFISKERGEVILDIDNAQGDTISSTEFPRGTHANKILQAIRDYFDNGTTPQADNAPTVSQFRYSAQEGRYRDLMGEKPAKYVRGLESRLVNELAENLNVPAQAKREVLRPMAERALRMFFMDGDIDPQSLNDLFERAYKAGIEEDTEYIERYGEIKKFIRDQKISISEEDRADIADFNLFRKAAFGTLTISKDGLPVDVAYQQLREEAPELFPFDITAPSDQLMRIYEAASGIKKVQKTLDEYWGKQAKAFKENQRAMFTESIDRLTSGLRIAQRYLDAQEKTKEKLAIPQTEEETRQMWAQLKDARRAVEKAQGKTLLTEADQKVVNRLLRGETSPEYAAKLENGAQILRVYEAKAEYDMLALKLKAWNVQRRNALRDFVEQALTEAEATKWVDKKAGILYSRETMERNIRDIARKGKISDEKANAFINKYFWPVHENESKRKNYIVAAQEKIRALKLDRQVRKGNMVSESYAVQWLGEAEFNREYLKQHPRTERRGGMTFAEWNAAIQEFEKQNPDMDLERVRAAVRTFHEVYDQLFQDMNRVRIENGYEPVNYLQGYFPHFQEGEEGGNILQKFARAAGIEGDVTPLPATINGLTAKFRPGIRYMANVQQRLGYATAYDALQGFDRYIEVASDVIFHTADIQRLRALATQIRWRASDEGLQARIDAIRTNPFLNPDEANDQIANLTKDGRYALSNFVDELDEYTNLLAGKKSRLDRGMEKLVGRKFYNVMKKFESRVGANMAAANVGSALTNFIPITQAWSQVSTTDVLRGMWDTLKNYKQADGLDAASSFINNRSGYGRLATSTMDKVSAAAGVLMEGIDGFTTGSVVRARYYQNLRRGMSEANAMQEADQFAAGVMADRSKGSTPTLYTARNPLVKLFTQFQLEVNNELSWIFKDMAQEERKKGVAALAKAMFKFLIGAWIYNEAYEALAGRRAALDPLDIINDTVGDITGYQIPNTIDALTTGKWDSKTQQESVYGTTANLVQNLLGELPFTQVLTMLGLEVDNGRIAVASAIPDLAAVLKAATDKDIDKKKREYTIERELAKPAYYLVAPFGGGQLRKLYQGGMAAAEGGSYAVDNEGNDILQYPVYNDNIADSAKSWPQALLFGKTATEEAQKWVESGFKSLSAKETAAYQAITGAGEDQRETYAFVQAVRKGEKEYDKKMLLKAYDISETTKAEYFYQVFASDDQKVEMDELDAQGRAKYVRDALAKAEDDHNRDELRSAVTAGTVTQEKAIQKMVANDWAKDENDAYWKYRDWTGGKDWKKYDALLQTVDANGNVAEAAKDYLEHGVEAKTLASEITTAYKPQYINATNAERRELKKKLLDAYAALGYNRSKKSDDIDRWLKGSWK